MVETTLTRGRVEPGQVDRLREWFAELREREAEVERTLENEGVDTETAFLEVRGGEAYLWYYLEAESVEAALSAYEESDHAIDREHAAVLEEAIAGWETDVVETLAHFTHPER